MWSASGRGQISGPPGLGGLNAAQMHEVTSLALCSIAKTTRRRKILMDVNVSDMIFVT